MNDMGGLGQTQAGTLKSFTGTWNFLCQRFIAVIQSCRILDLHRLWVIALGIFFKHCFALCMCFQKLYLDLADLAATQVLERNETIPAEEVHWLSVNDLKPWASPGPYACRICAGRQMSALGTWPACWMQRRRKTLLDAFLWQQSKMNQTWTKHDQQISAITYN